MLIGNLFNINQQAALIWFSSPWQRDLSTNLAVTSLHKLLQHHDISLNQVLPWELQLYFQQSWMTLRCSKWVSHVFAAVPFSLQFSHRVPALEKYVWPWRAPYYAWATITPRIQRDSWLWCHWHAPDIPSWMVHPTSNTFTQKKALCLGCSWRDWFWKVLANLAAVRPTAKRRETSHNVQKPPGCMDRVLRSKWPVHMFFFSFFSTMYQNHLQTWQRLQTTEQKNYIKTTWKTQ